MQSDAATTTLPSMTTEQFHELVPLAATLGIELISADRERVVMRLTHDERLCTAGGVLHGGALMGLADTAGALLAFLLLPEGAGGTTTVQSTTNFIRAARGGTVTVTTRPLHAGRRNIVVESEMRDDERKLLAKTTQTQAVL